MFWDQKKNGDSFHHRIYSKKRKWKWAGHKVRMKDNRWRARRAKRSREWPSRRWWDDVIKKKGTTWSRTNTGQTTVDRHWWRAKSCSGWFQFQFQLKMASLRSERPIHAPPPSLSSFPKVAIETELLLAWLNTDRFGPWGRNVDRFLSPLFFPSGDQCCDALVCPCWESSSSLWAPLPCHAANQMWYLLCLPVYLPFYSHWLRRAQDVRYKQRIDTA